MIRRRANVLVLLFGLSLVLTPAFAVKKVKNPILEEAPDGTRSLLLPPELETFLLSEFPGYRFPKDTDFSSEMLQYYFSRLIGVHPSIAWGDFNGDRRKDYLMLIITGDTKWGPQCELIALNGQKKTFDVYRLGEVYNFKEDYVSFASGKLYKGRYRKNGWYINWDPKKKRYTVHKS